MPHHTVAVPSPFTLKSSAASNSSSIRTRQDSDAALQSPPQFLKATWSHGSPLSVPARGGTLNLPRTSVRPATDSFKPGGRQGRENSEMVFIGHGRERDQQELTVW